MSVDDMRAEIYTAHTKIVSSSIRDDIQIKSAKANAESTSFASMMAKHFDMTQNKVVDIRSQSNATQTSDTKTVSSSDIAELLSSIRKV